MAADSPDQGAPWERDWSQLPEPQPAPWERNWAASGTAPPPEKPTPPVEPPSLMGRIGEAATGAAKAARDWAVGQHEAIGEATSQPFKEAWNAPETPNTPENRGDAPPWLFDVLNKAQRAVNLGTASFPAAIGAVAAAMGLDPNKVNQAVNDYLPALGIPELETAMGLAKPAVHQLLGGPGTDALKNIAEGKPAAAPRPEEAATPQGIEPTVAPPGAAPVPSGNVAIGNDALQQWARSQARQAPQQPAPTPAPAAAADAPAKPPWTPPATPGMWGAPESADERLEEIAGERPPADMAGRPVAEGEKPTPTPASARAPAPNSTVRMYHGGAESDLNQPGPRWFSSDRQYAERYAAKTPDGRVSYVDLPRDHPLVAPEYPEQSIDRGFHVLRELPSEIAEKRQPLSAEEPPPFETREEPAAPPVKRPPNLIEFLAERGGLENDAGGDLEAMDAHKRFVPGAGMLVRKTGGMSLDEAREAAEEAGYIQPGSDINSLLGALDENLRGRHVFSDRDLSQAEDWRQQQWAERQPGMAAEAQPFAAHAESWQERAPSDEHWEKAGQDGIPWGKYPGVARDLTGDFSRWYAANRARYTGMNAQMAMNIAAMQWLHEMGRDNPVEHMTITSPLLGQRSLTSGLYNMVQVPPGLALALRDPKADAVIQHNHPTPWGLSGDDLAFPMKAGVRAIVAHDVEGNMHAVSATPYGRAVGAGRSAAGATRWDHITAAAINAVVDHLAKDVKDGIITKDDMSRIGWDAVGHSLASAGMIDYVTTRRPPEQYSEARWRQIIGSGAEAALARAYQDAAARAPDYQALSTEYRRRFANAAAYQPTRFGSADDAMARILGQSQEPLPAEPRAGIAWPDQNRPANYQPPQEARAGPGTEGQLGVEGQTQLPPARREGAPGTQYRLLTNRTAAEPAFHRHPEQQSELPSEPTDQGEQRVIPGAERRPEEAARAKAAADKERAQQQMKGAAQPKKPQQDFGSTGLGGGNGTQGSLFSQRFGRQGQLPVATKQQVRRNGIIAASALRKLFSPSTVSDIAGETAGTIRGGLGMGRRIHEQAASTLQRFYSASPRLNTPEGDNLMAYMEGRSAGVKLATPEFQPLADQIRALNKDRAARILALPQQAQRKFFDDYFAHMWKDPKKAADAFQGGVPKQGSGRNLKTRTVPTYADGIKMGLQPLHPNIVEGELSYLQNMDRFLAWSEIDNRMQASGTARWMIPGKQPEGWVQLNGARSQKTTPDGIPLQLYAPEDAARVYNNSISRGVYGTDLGPVYDKFLRAKNGMTMAELSLSAFHAVTMTNEAFFSEIARGFMDIASGHPIRGLGKVSASPAAAINYYRLGSKVADEWLKPGTHGGLPALSADAMQRANVSPIGRGAAQYYTAKRGAYKSIGDFKGAMRETARDIGTHPLAGPFRQFAQQTGRVLDTTVSPLFDHFIPRLKAGAFAARYGDWMQQHPGAIPAERFEAERNIADSIDNRFGELNYDNLMWHTAMKQGAFLSMRAFGWTIGTWREIGGGMADMARGRLTERAAYVAALGVGTVALNALFSYLHTGKQPTAQDLYAYDTGKKDSYGHEIRAVIPGYAREFTGLAANLYARGSGGAESYLGGKAASLWSMAVNLMENRDYRDDPIGPPGAGLTTEKGREQLPEFLKRYFKEAMGHYTPLSLRDAFGLEDSNMMEGLNPVERALAVRKAPFAEQDPAAARKAFEKMEAHPKSPQQRWQAKLRRERREAAEP